VFKCGQTELLDQVTGGDIVVLMFGFVL